MELLLALEAMEIEQTARDNILYVLDTVFFFFFFHSPSPHREAVSEDSVFFCFFFLSAMRALGL